MLLTWQKCIAGSTRAFVKERRHVAEIVNNCMEALQWPDGGSTMLPCRECVARMHAFRLVFNQLRFEYEFEMQEDCTV